ncbi:MAG TPA: 2-oxoglutarate dehydrogenase E1 component [Gemmatimonadaceae bacterium]|jgi:2-oxoglutarate dehydrogenase E1 component|nr:2-oxoglutarate dehydrogenase E1 component [Gemmatimonadaceae bacterium]
MLPITSVFNDGYIAEQYETYRRDPAAVDESWRQFFRFAEHVGGRGTVATGVDASLLRKAAAAASLISAIKSFGHLAVQIDPLGSAPAGAAELKPEFHGITESDLTDIPASALGHDTGTAADVVQRTRELYCGTIGYEFEHLSEETEREWFRSTIEDATVAGPLTAEDKKALLQRLTEVDGLERFLGLAYVSVKRFSIEGVDALVPMLDEAIAQGAKTGARQIVIGMAHRGRLNVLTHVMGKSYRALLEEFEGRHPATNAESDTGDVKYHKGYRGTRDVPGAGAVTIELVPNPSHLEVVNPVVAGVARARQRVAGGAPNARDESSVLPIVVHGDASFPGEGVVAETLNMALLRGYRVGGTLHVIANNQVGFTTDPIDARSTHYASDLAKGFEIPVVHVNADDAESCLQVVRLAVAYRHRFHKDFLIDLVGYRRHGHNEADQPAFTQPLMYKSISEHPTPREVFGARLVRERVVSEGDVAAADKSLKDRLQGIYQEMKKSEAADTRSEEPAPPPPSGSVETAVRPEKLVALNEQLLSWPSVFKLHPTMQRTLPRRRDAISKGGIDWGHAESLAFASLLTDGVSVRITGQDAERGTFSHRQAVLHDVNTGELFTPLQNLPQASGAFEIYNSPLSETAVMGFEYGFSIAAPDELVLWEAQYGDFANVAQPIVDQFISAGRAKWRQESGLVLLLPHGYEGQGPEHSSARLERYLQLAAEDNMVVAYPSTPAQYFHVLRRQAMRRPRKPLVLMQPKSLLRMPEAASRLEDLTGGTFRAVIDDPIVSRNRDAVQRLVFCTGKIYYDLTSSADRPNNVAVIRVEELAPWPREVADVVDLYPNVDEVAWAQEEPKNMGAWTYVQPRLRASIGTLTTLRYIGRPERSSPAEGYKQSHDDEQARIVKDALTYAPSASSRRKAGAARG